MSGNLSIDGKSGTSSGSKNSKNQKLKKSMFIDKSDNTYYSVPGSTDNAKKQGLIYDSQYFMTK